MRNTILAILIAGMAIGGTGFGTADAGSCPPGYEGVLVAGTVHCAHHDQVPANGTRPTSLYSAEAEARALTCFGSGTDGNRLQAVYATESEPTLSSSDRASIVQGMINVQAVYRASSRIVSDTEVIPRWVHSADCEPSIDVVQVPPGALDDFAGTIQALGDQGRNRPDRKYIVWADATEYCGIAATSIDDSKVDNLNDGRHPGYARTDRGCWGYQGSVVAHEVTHTLGGVQPSAPHATPNGHCTDEFDIMCYPDGPGTTTTVECPDLRSELSLDCNNDDYFHPTPPAGNWLYSHWNVADSSFVERVVGGEAADPVVDAESDQPFVDVGRESPHGRAIGWLADRGVTDGCGTGRFCPDQPVTRGQMAAFLHRLVPKLDPMGGAKAFGDVAPSDPFVADIAWLVGTGVTRGCGEATFCPDQSVSRNQMAAFLYRIFAGGARIDAGGFSDVPPGSAFETEIAWLAAAGISRGCGENLFCPDAPVTRAQMASFLFRVSEMYLPDG